MKLEIKSDSSNYTCQVIKLPAKQKVEGLDNLVRVNVFGNDCLIGKDSPEDELYLLFPAECALAKEFLSSNNLYRESTLNRDKSKTGFFEEKGRVKAVKFRGVISTGFVIPVSSLDSLGTFKLNVGDEFNSINGHDLCWKYKIVQTQGSGTKGSKRDNKLKRFDKLVPNQFRFHQDTSQLAKNLHLFRPTDIIVITDKWHGTSAVFSNVLIKKELTLKEKIALWFGLNIIDHVYDVLYSSRSVIKNQYINKEQDGGYYNEDIWGTVNAELNGKIEQGITLYGEIVGYLQSGKFIQKGYDYGCKPSNVANFDLPKAGQVVQMNGLIVKPEHRFLVYRMTYTKPDGSVIELSWNQIKEYCSKYSLETVKELYFATASVRLQNLSGPELEEWQQQFFNTLSAKYLEQDCTHCINKVPAEGVVVRRDGLESYSAFKLKAKKFLARESNELDKGEVDIETVESIAA